MDYDGAGIQTRGARATAAAVTEASSSLFAPLLDEETLWQMNMRGNESMESGSYPQRPGELDCAYYLRTGLCRYGVTCRYNHPPKRKLVLLNVRLLLLQDLRVDILKESVNLSVSIMLRLEHANLELRANFTTPKIRLEFLGELN